MIHYCLIFLIIYFKLCWPFVAAGALSLVVVSRVAASRILTAVASLVEEHWLSVLRLQ